MAKDGTPKSPEAMCQSFINADLTGVFADGTAALPPGLLEWQDDLSQSSVPPNSLSTMQSFNSGFISPSASQPDNSSVQMSEATGAITLSQLTFINNLLNEKGQLMKDKEDLLKSKSQLWNEYYQAVKVRDEDIVRLKEMTRALEEDLAGQKRRTRRLAKALEHYVQSEEDQDGQSNHKMEANEVKVESTNSRAKHALPSSMKVTEWLSTAESDHAKKEVPSEEVFSEARKQLYEMYGAPECALAVEDDEPSSKRLKLSPGDPKQRITGDQALEPMTGARSLDQTCNQNNGASPISEQLPEPRSPGAVGKTSAFASLARLRLKAQARQLSRSEIQGSAPHGGTREDFQTAKDSRRSADNVPGESVNLEDPGKLSMVAKLRSELLIPQGFTFTPMIRPSEYGQVDLEHVDIAALESIRDFLEQLRDRVTAGTVAAQPKGRTTKGCGYKWMYGSGYRVRWTKEGRRLYTCFSCFQARRVCCVWQGKGRWEMLPLPTQIRASSVSPADPGYYVYADNSTFDRVSHVWEPRKDKHEH